MTRFAKIAVWPLLAVAAGSLALVACGEDEASNDSGRIDVPKADAFVIAIPDGYSNASARCFGTDMIYTTRNDTGRAIAVSPNHPWCADGVLTADEMDR